MSQHESTKNPRSDEEQEQSQDKTTPRYGWGRPRYWSERQSSYLSGPYAGPGPRWGEQEGVEPSATKDDMTMATREIPTHEWPTFFADYTREHRGQPVTMRVFGVDIGAQEEARLLPFVGISGDWKDGENQIFITLGDQSTDHLTHTITDPTHLRLRQAEGAAGETIEIEGANGDRTLVSFSS